jgi:3-isopropylmalate/(R)-2-methylmalate dehydratase large subunit
VSTFEPCVAEPHLPSNYARAKDRFGVKLDRAYLGSCTGGKLTDFVMAARILKGQTVKIDTFLVPATCEVAEGLIREKIDGKSLVEIFADAGCKDIAPPSCAACLGGPEDTFGRTHGREVVISTTNRNFVGRMGSKDAPIYLASPLTVAASAIKGRITDPREFM